MAFRPEWRKAQILLVNLEAVLQLFLHVPCVCSLKKHVLSSYYVQSRTLFISTGKAGMLITAIKLSNIHIYKATNRYDIIQIQYRHKQRAKDTWKKEQSIPTGSSDSFTCRVGKREKGIAMLRYAGSQLPCTGQWPAATSESPLELQAALLRGSPHMLFVR